MFSLFSSAEDDTNAAKPPTADQEASLLSGVASWFGYGGSSNPVGNRVKEDVDFETEDAELDWVLVDKRNPTPAGCPKQDASEADDGDMSAEETESSESDSDEETESFASEDSICFLDTATSTYQVEHEHGWVMTPRPCFTRSDKRRVEYNVSEDLLIEHPSMSVYEKLAIVDGDLGARGFWFNEVFYDATRKRLIDDYCCLHWAALSSTDSTNSYVLDMPVFPIDRDAKKGIWATKYPEGCHHRQESKLELMARVKAVKSSQRKQQQKEKQGLNRKHLQRQNKNTVMQCQGKRANRNNRARNTSGAMKSRIPQRRH